MTSPQPMEISSPNGKPSNGPAAPSDARLIAICSGKGGVGKTCLAITLAHALSRRNRRVLLFDGDLGLANIDVQLGLLADSDLGAFFSGDKSLAQTARRFEAGGFDVIAGHSGTGRLVGIGAERLGRLREGLFDLADSYDHVVIDLGAGIDRPVQILAARCPVILVLVTEEPTSLTDAYACIKVLHAAGAGAAIRIVVNMAADERHGQNTYQTLRRACHRFLSLAPPLAGIVQRSAHIPDAIRHQVPLLTRHPASPAASDGERLAESITEPR